MPRQYSRRVPQLEFEMLGCYFQRSAAQSTPQRRAAQRGFVFLAIFWLFAAVSGAGKAYLPR